MSKINIKQAHLQDLDSLVPLFDGYRIFYKQESDIEGARVFLKERLELEEAVIFIAFMNEEAIGFTQLYPTFSSVSLERSYILNDLFVHNKHRRIGAADALLTHAQKWCKHHGYKGLALETATDNPAQHLYEKLGWKKDVEYLHYFWSAKS